MGVAENASPQEHSSQKFFQANATWPSKTQDEKTALDFCKAVLANPTGRVPFVSDIFYEKVNEYWFDNDWRNDVVNWPSVKNFIRLYSKGFEMPIMQHGGTGRQRLTVCTNMTGNLISVDNLDQLCKSGGGGGTSQSHKDASGCSSRAQSPAPGDRRSRRIAAQNQPADGCNRDRYQFRSRKQSPSPFRSPFSPRIKKN